MYTCFRAQFNQVELIEQRWTWSNKTHVAFENASELRKLVQTGFSYEAAYSGQMGTWITQQMRRYRRRANLHAAKLGHFENLVISAYAVRPIQRGAF